MDEDEPLVRAMPRGPLYGLQGFTSRIDINVLSAVAEDGWCSTRLAIAGDVDAKEVRVGAMVVRREPSGPQVLVDGTASVLGVADVLPEVNGLPGLKTLAQGLARRRCPQVRGVEMAGYLNDDRLPELRRVFIIVYRAIVPPGTPSGDGLAWVSRPALTGMALEPVSAQVLDAIS